MEKRGQASMEYIIIIGFSLILISSGMYIFFGFSDSFKILTINAKLEEVNQNLINSVNKVSYHGNGSRITTDVVFPGGIDKFGILSSSTETYLVYVLYNNDTNIYDVKINLTCGAYCQINNNLHEQCTIDTSFTCFQFLDEYAGSGRKYFRFEANDSQIEVLMN